MEEDGLLRNLGGERERERERVEESGKYDCNFEIINTILPFGKPLCFVCFVVEGTSML